MSIVKTIEVRKNKIIDFLKKNKGENPTSKIATHTGINFWSVEAILWEMENDGKISVRKESNRTYWRLEK